MVILWLYSERVEMVILWFYVQADDAFFLYGMHSVFCTLYCVNMLGCVTQIQLPETIDNKEENINNKQNKPILPPSLQSPVPRRWAQYEESRGN